jgi:hypothetical protein
VKRWRRILSVFLIVAFAGYLVPIADMADRNHDRSVDLKDAILVVKDFVDSAQQPVGFTSAARSAFTVLTIAAGLNTTITSSKDTSSTNQRAAADSLFLAATTIPALLETAEAWVKDSSSHFSSIVFAPAPPPPEPC